MCGGNGGRPSLGWVDGPKRAMALGPSHARARVSGQRKQNTGPGPNRPSLSVMSVRGRLQHGASIEDRYPERVDFGKSPWGNSWLTASPSPGQDDLEGGGEGSRGACLPLWGAPEPAAPAGAPLGVARRELALLLQRPPACLRAPGDHGFHLGQFWGREAILSVEPSYHPSCGDGRVEVRVTREGRTSKRLASVVQRKSPGFLGCGLRTP